MGVNYSFKNSYRIAGLIKNIETSLIYESPIKKYLRLKMMLYESIPGSI